MSTKYKRKEFNVQKKKRALKNNYKKCISRLKRYKGVTSIVISVRGELYDTTLENLQVAEFINNKFNAFCVRARRDVRDIDSNDDVKCIRITTLYYEAIIGLGGKADREFMIFVTQKTPESIERPRKKPKLTSVYLESTDPMKQKRSRKDPVKDLQMELFGITSDAAEQQIVQQQLDETRAVKIAEMETTRKKEERIKTLTRVTTKTLEAVKPPGAQIDRMDYIRKKALEKRQRDPKSQQRKLPDLAKQEDDIFNKMGYYKPRLTRRVSIYDEAGYKIRGDVEIGYRPIFDQVLFPMKKLMEKNYKPRGVFHDNKCVKYGDEPEENTSAKIQESQIAEEAEEEEDEFKDI